MLSAAGSLDGISFSQIPNDAAKHLASRKLHFDPGGASLGEFILVTVVSQGRGYASLNRRDSGGMVCSVWLEKQLPDGFHQFGFVDADQAPGNSSTCRTFRLRKRAGGSVDIEWQKARGVGRLLSAYALKPVNWSVLPTSQFAAGGLNLGLDDPASQGLGVGGNGTPVHYPGGCRGCKSTLTRRLIRTSDAIGQPRTSGSYVQGRSVLGGYRGRAVSLYNYSLAYRDRYPDVSEFVGFVEKQYGTPSLTLMRDLVLRDMEVPESFIWAFDLDGRKLDADEVQNLCNPHNGRIARVKSYDGDSDLNPWGCGLIFSVDIDYRNTNTTKPWVGKYRAVAHSPWSLSHHHFADRLKRVAEKRQKAVDNERFTE